MSDIQILASDLDLVCFGFQSWRLVTDVTDTLKLGRWNNEHFNLSIHFDETSAVLLPCSISWCKYISMAPWLALLWAFPRASKNSAWPGSLQHFPTNEVHILPACLAGSRCLGHSLMGISLPSMHPFCLALCHCHSGACVHDMSSAASHQLVAGGGT